MAGDTERKVRTTSLDVARLVAGATGFPDVDVEPQEPGRVVVTASGPGKTLRATGATIYDACEKLIRLMAPVPPESEE
jgi:hypothetical protein